MLQVYGFNLHLPIHVNIKQIRMYALFNIAFLFIYYIHVYG